jgi:threonine dehydrogenase-like Zn-dependent dehydrogenase
MKVKAAVLVADRTIEMRELTTPERPQPGGMLLRVEGCGMCGSDIEQYEGVIARSGTMRYPCIPGHETIGRIAAIDAETAQRRGVKEGDRVAIHGVAPCGVCRGCMAGQSCQDAFYYGFRSLDQGSGLWGGFSEWMEITPRTKVYPVDGALSIEDALLFNPFAAGYDWVVREGRLQVGQSVLILGAGQRGLASVLAAREAGAAQIIVTGLARDAFKLEIARQFGATTILVAETQDVAAAVLDLTGGQGVDLAVDTTPLAFQPIQDAIKAVKKGGTIVLGGIKGFVPMPEFPVDVFLHKQIRMVGVLSSTHWAVQQAIRLVESRRFPLHLMHTHRFGLEQVEHAVHLLAGEVPGETALHISIIPN